MSWVSYFQTSIFFFDLMVLPLFEVVFALAPFEALGRDDLLTNLAGLRDSHIFGRIPFFLTNLAPSSATLPVVVAFVWVRWPLAGSPILYRELRYDRAWICLTMAQAQGLVLGKTAKL